MFDQFFNRDGSLKPGNIGYEYQQQLINELKRTLYDKGYLKGVKFVLNDLAEKILPLVKLDIESFDAIKQLPEYGKELQIYLEALRNYMSALKSQVNNRNASSFREGTRQAILKAEKICKVSRGTFINPLLAKDEVKFTEEEKSNDKISNTIKEKKNTKQNSTPKPKKRKKKSFDPTDVLINNIEETPSEE